jgi:hypothetical protein
MGAVNQVVQQVSNVATQVLQPVEKAINQGVTDVGKTISNSPALEGAITAIAAFYGVPPAATAAFLAANKTSQTGGNLEKGLETLVLSYGAGKLMAPGAIDLSSPTAIDQSVAQAQAAAPAAAPAAAAPAATPIANVGAAASPAPASNVVGTSLGDLAATAPAGAAVPAAGTALTPAAIESLTGQAGYGVNAAAQAAASGLGIDPALVGAGAEIGTPSALSGFLSQAGNAIGNTLGNLSGTQLAALGTGATGLYNASATREAMQQAIAAQQATTAASQGTLGNIYNQQLGYQAPYQAAGVGAVNQLAGMTPYLTHQFNAADLQAGLAPNYDFMLQQGQQANQRAANVGGGALGGNALTGLNKYTQDYAGNAYQNAFNNYQNQRTGIYNNLAGIANIGQTANVGAGTAGTNYGQGTVGLNTGLGNAQAANILGQAQVGAGGVTNAANTAFLATLLGQNTPTTGTTTGGSTGGVSLGDIAKLGSLTSGLGNAWTGLTSFFK